MDFQPSLHFARLLMYSKIFSHTQQPLFRFLPHIHLSFIGWGFYFSKLSLNIVIISQFLSAWGKRIITRNTVIIFLWRFKGMLFFSFFSQAAGPFMIKLFLELVFGMSGFSLRDSCHHVSQQCFINCLMFHFFIHIIISETLQSLLGDFVWFSVYHNLVPPLALLPRWGYSTFLAGYCLIQCS